MPTRCTCLSKVPMRTLSPCIRQILFFKHVCVGEQQLGTARLLLHKELGGSVTGNGQCRPKGDWLDGGCRCFRGAFAGFCGDQLRLCFFTVPATAIVRPPCEYQSQWHSDTKRRLHACAVKSSFTLEHVTLLHYFTRI